MRSSNSVVTVLFCAFLRKIIQILLKCQFFFRVFDNLEIIIANYISYITSVAVL